MERKIGETFEFEGKIYKVVKFNGCGNCAFRYNDCPNLGPVIGNCMDLVRSDGVKVMFKEIENMEIKDNKLTINIPEGMEIDMLNSKFGTGVICFKKKQTEFKYGDIAFADFGNTQYVFIVSGKTDLSECYYSFISLNLNTTKALNIGYRTSFFKENLDTIRLATEEEKQQLFEALAKDFKVWDSEKKQIVDLKPKWITPKPFDRVITRGDNNDIWTANIFSHMNSYGEYVAIGCVGGYHYCLPYNDETAHLVGTTDEWKGGEV